MRAFQAMTRDVVVIRPDFPLSYAWELMKNRRVRHLPVALEGELVGMLSDRDIRTWSQMRVDGSLAVPAIRVSVAMSRPVLTCGREEDVSHLARKMIERKIDAVAVTNSAGQLLGLVTSTDLLELLLEHGESNVIPFDVKELTLDQQRQLRAI
jgi:CBS domain-containing protein